MIREHGGNIGEISRHFGIDPEKIIDFSASINPLGYPHGVKEAILETFDAVLHYPDIDSFELVNSLSRYHGVDRNCILTGNGSTEFMYLLPMVVKPKRALIVTPAFGEYEKGLKIAGTAVEYFPTFRDAGFSINTDLLRRRLSEGFDILYLCNPANPTGRLVPKEMVRTVLARAEDTRTMCVVDEAFIDFVEEESVKNEIHDFPGLIVLRSMTKFFGLPGLRAGYVIGPASHVEAMKKQQTPWTVNALVQKAAAAALKDKGYIARTRAYVAAERECLRSALNKIPGLTAFESAANFLLVFLDGTIGFGSTELRRRLIPEGVLVRDCNSFHGLGDRYIRVAVRKNNENKALVEALKRIMS